MEQAIENKNQLVAQGERKLTNSEKFTSKVLAEFGSSAGAIEVSEYQRKLIQNYFVSIDAALKAAELRRKSNEPLSVTWNNVNMNVLALDVVKIARLGLDSAVKNHIHFTPFKNNKLNKYDIVFITGYTGLEFVAKKYALDMPTGVITELVYSNDKFKPIKKSLANKYESYEFEIENPFDRGKVVGGFYYIMYENPEKNKLTIMTVKDIEKRKPKYASPEFWGGEKDKWENGHKVGKEEVEGWYDEMCLKTVKRAAYSSIPLDPTKIDDNYQYLKRRESEMSEMEVEQEIDENANKEHIDFDGAEVKNAEIVEDKQPEPETETEQKEESAKDQGKEAEQMQISDKKPNW